jgi:protease I
MKFFDEKLFNLQRKGEFMNGKKLKKIAVFTEDLYEDMELWYPYYRLKEEGHTVRIVGPLKKTYMSKHNYPAEVDIPIEEALKIEWDALIIPGGYSPDRVRRNEKMLDLVKRMNDESKIIGAICHAGWVLISAGITKGRRLTSFYSIKDDLINSGAEWIDRELVIDGNLVTSRYPDDLPAFAGGIIDSLK